MTAPTTCWWRPVTEQINWPEMRVGLIGLAELIFTYHQALLGAGFGEAQTLALALGYQEHLLTAARAAEAETAKRRRFFG